MTVGTMSILIALTAGGFIVGFTHGKQWSFIAGIHGACICLVHGPVAFGIYSLIQ